MTVLEAMKTYLSALPGLSGLQLEDLGRSPGDCCLRSLPGEQLLREYLTGAQLLRLQMELLLRGAGGSETDRESCFQQTEALMEALWQRTRRGDLPELGEGKRAFSLKLLETAAPEVYQEDGLLVDRITLELRYFQEG